MDTSAIERARDIAGGTVALANALGVSAPTVSEWIVGKRRVPLERCPAIELLTGVSKKELRPDVDWAALSEPRGDEQQLAMNRLPRAPRQMS